MKEIHRRGFMKFAGLSLGIGTLYRVIPAFGADSALGGFLADMRRSNGESMSPFRRTFGKKAAPATAPARHRLDRPQAVRARLWEGYRPVQQVRQASATLSAKPSATHCTRHERSRGEGRRSQETRG